MANQTLNSQAAATGNADAKDQLNQALANSDTAVVQAINGAAAIRQARVAQMQRDLEDLTAQYGADDPQVISLQKTVDANTVVAGQLRALHQQVSTAAPEVSANGWALYGTVRNSDFSPVAKQTVLLVDAQKNWARQYGYTFSNDQGQYSLVYDGAATKTGAAELPKLYVAVLNESRNLVYLDSDVFAPTLGQAEYRDLIISSTPIGTPPTPSTAGEVPVKTATPVATTTAAKDTSASPTTKESSSMAATKESPSPAEPAKKTTRAKKKPATEGQ